MKHQYLRFCLGMVVTMLFLSSFSMANEIELRPVESSFDQSQVTLTQWADPSGSQPMTYQQWLTNQPSARSFSFERVSGLSTFANSRSGGSLAIIINSDLVVPLQEALDLYVQDLTGEGYTVDVFATSGGTPTDLRAELLTRHLAGMESCVFIGDLPVAWYETDFGDPPSHAEFPIDLFYMDLDGVFSDNDSDGKYDAHTGDVALEIWMGRMTTSPLTYNGGDEVDLLVHYFDKNHRYRSDHLPVNNRALVYVEDDWHGGADQWNLDVGLAYNERTFVKDKYETFAPDYEDRLDDNYELIEVCVHSWSAGHQFTNPSSQYSYTYFYDLPVIHPVAHFYNLFACSNALYTATDYMSGWYIFGDDYGLAAVGCAKSGSMLYFDDFYEPFGRGESIGKSFFDWFNARAVGGFEEWEITWFYGMTLNGDPTLKAQSLSSTQIVRYDNGVAYMMSLPNDSWDLYNVRFTAEEDGQLNYILAEGGFPDAVEGMIFIYESDGMFPTTVIDSIPFTGTGGRSVDLFSRSIFFSAGESFHVAYSSRGPTATDTIQIYMDDALVPTDRSSLLENGVWKRLDQVWGTSYNICIRAEMIGPPRPSIEITTDDLALIRAGSEYDLSLATEGGELPFSWSVSAGTLPDGITLDTESGKLSGSATTTGIFTFSIRVDDSSAPQLDDVQHLSLEVDLPCGDANADGVGPDITDLVYIVTYMFGGGPIPPQMELVDVDGSGFGPDIADLVYLVTYMFQGGPALVCP